MAPETADRAQLDALATEILGALFAALRTLQVHSVANAAVAGTAQKLGSLFADACHQTRPSQLVFLEDDVYFNGGRVRVPRQELPRYVALVRELKQLGVLRIDASAPPAEPDVLGLLDAIAHPREGAHRATFGALAVEFARDRAGRLPENLIDRRQYALRVYAKAVLFLQDAVQAVQNGQIPAVRKAYRLVQDLIDLASTDIIPLLGLASIRDHGDFIFHHSVNVAVLSIVMGQRLKMGKQPLAELGMAALLHDLGKLSVPRETLYKEGKLSDEERRQLDQIPRETLRLLLKHQLVGRGHPIQLILAYEHHLVKSVKDYVQIYGQRSLYYQTQIMSVANFYDALTTARAHRGPYLPDQALQLINSLAGDRFDPVIVRVFTNVIGVFPLGTLVLLDDGTSGVVVHTVPERPRRPLLKIVLDSNKERIDGPYVDLAAEGESRRILSSLNPSEHEINPLKYLMAETPGT